MARNNHNNPAGFGNSLGDLLNDTPGLDAACRENEVLDDLCYLFNMAVKNNEETQMLAEHSYHFSMIEPQDFIDDASFSRVENMFEIVDLSYEISRVGTDKILAMTADFHEYPKAAPDAGQQAQAKTGFANDLCQQQKDIEALARRTEDFTLALMNYPDYADEERVEQYVELAYLMNDNRDALKSMFKARSYPESSGKSPVRLVKEFKKVNGELAVLNQKLLAKVLEQAENAISSAMMLEAVFIRGNPQSPFMMSRVRELLDAEGYLQWAVQLHQRGKDLTQTSKVAPVFA